MRKSFIAISLAFTLSFGAVGEESVILTDILAQSMEQIKKINDQIKIMTDTLDQVDKVNNMLNSVDHLIFESGEKLFNPKQTLEKIVNKYKALQKRFEDYPEKFKNGFGYDRFFKDYHNVTCRTEWSGAEIEEFNKIEKATGIKIEELKIRRCIEENLTKAQTQEQKDTLTQIDELIKNGDYAGALELIEKLRRINITKDMSRNAGIMNSAKVLNDVFLDYNSKNDENLTQIEAIQEDIKKITTQIQTNSSPDLIGSLSNLNALIINLVSLAEKSYTAQMAFYKAYNDFQIAIYGKKAQTPEEMQEFKDKGEKPKVKAFYEDVLKSPKVKYDDLGLPIF